MVKRATRPSQTDPQFKPQGYHRPFKSSELWAGATEYGIEKSREIQAKIKAFTSKKPNKDWAKRILDRVKEGEHIAPRAVEMALQVAGDAPAPYATDEREPGSDDE